MSNKVILGDCLQEMRSIPDKSIDMILCDLPYQITQCKWDIAIPFEPLWKEYTRVAKESAAIVLTAANPFASMCIVNSPPYILNTNGFGKRMLVQDS